MGVPPESRRGAPVEPSGRWRARARRAARVIAAGGLPTLLAGCFTFAPAEATGVREGEMVRISLTTTGATRLSALGVDVGSTGGADPSISGSWIRRRDGGLGVRVPIATPPAGGEPIVQEVVLAPTEVLRLDRRRLSRSRTAVATVGVVGLGTATFLLIVTGSAGEPHLPLPGGPDDVRIPVTSGSSLRLEP